MSLLRIINFDDGFEATEWVGGRRPIAANQDVEVRSFGTGIQAELLSRQPSALKLLEAVVATRSGSLSTACQLAHDAAGRDGGRLGDLAAFGEQASLGSSTNKVRHKQRGINGTASAVSGCHSVGVPGCTERLARRTVPS